MEKQKLLNQIDEVKKDCPYKYKPFRELYLEGVEKCEMMIKSIESSHRTFISSTELIYAICKAYADMNDYRIDGEERKKQSTKFDKLFNELIHELGV